MNGSHKSSGSPFVGGRSRRRVNRKSRNRKRIHPSRSRNGGMWGHVINQAVVPFSILAMQQKYKKRGTNKRGKKRRNKTRRRF